MYSSRQLTAEVQDSIADLITADAKIVSAKALARDILAKHESIAGEDVEFYAFCSLEYLEDCVRLAFNRYKLKPESEARPDPQMLLPGFERLQRYYSIERDGDHRLVPIDELTPEEQSAKVAELRAMGRGCFEHADELERYTGRKAARTQR
jgi:hypothetical protein